MSILLAAVLFRIWAYTNKSNRGSFLDTNLQWTLQITWLIGIQKSLRFHYICFSNILNAFHQGRGYTGRVFSTWGNLKFLSDLTHVWHGSSNSDFSLKAHAEWQHNFLIDNPWKSWMPLAFYVSCMCYSSLKMKYLSTHNNPFLRILAVTYSNSDNGFHTASLSVRKPWGQATCPYKTNWKHLPQTKGLNLLSL